MLDIKNVDKSDKRENEFYTRKRIEHYFHDIALKISFPRYVRAQKCMYDTLRICLTVSYHVYAISSIIECMSLMSNVCRLEAITNCYSVKTAPSRCNVLLCYAYVLCLCGMCLFASVIK